ncbi:MAG: hypothetical protein K6G42_09500 [Lachnospiraceae bacterium]|nr:hypothetical protein [Lachnospiraceae bacterium]
MIIPEKYREAIWKIVAGLCLITAVLLLYRFIALDKDYKFDLEYLEENPDSYVVNCFNLRRGSFDLIVDYSTGTDVTGYVQADNDLSFDVPLPAGSDSATVPFSLAHPTDRFKITVPIEEGADITVNAIRLRSGRLPIFTDDLLYAVLLIIAAFCILRFHKKWDGTVLLLFLFILIVNIPYYQKTLGITADIRAHMQRIEGIMRGLADHQFPVVIAPNFVNEFGEISFLYPDMFLYPFGILRLLSVSMLTAYRLCMLCVNAATVIVAYLSLRLISTDRVLVIAGTFLITFEPYRLYNMLSRGSGAGNAVASIFLPLVVAGLYLILKGDRRWWVLSLGMTGVIESHILTLVILVLSLVVIGVVFSKELIKDKKYLLLGKAALLALIMNLGFLLIFMKCYLTDWDPSALEWSEFTDSQFGIYQMFTSPWSLFEIIALAVCIFLFVRVKERGNVEFKLSAVLTITGGFMFLTTLTVFPWRYLMDSFAAVERFTSMMQVPQRMYAVSSVFLICSMAILAGNIREMKGIRKDMIREPGVAVSLIIISLVLTFGIFKGYSDYFAKDPFMPDEVYGDHNSLPIKDYIPSGASEESWLSDVGFVSDESAVESLEYHKNGTHIDYTYIANGEGLYANMPLLYYEWYRAKDEMGDSLNVRKSDDGRVIVDLVGDGNRHEAHIYFDMGIAYSVIYAFSLIFIFAVVFRIFLKRGWRKNE